MTVAFKIISAALDEAYRIIHELEAERDAYRQIAILSRKPTEGTITAALEVAKEIDTEADRIKEHRCD